VLDGDPSDDESVELGVMLGSMALLDEDEPSDDELSDDESVELGTMEESVDDEDATSLDDESGRAATLDAKSTERMTICVNRAEQRILASHN
jgi:hypothetical protein